MRKLLGLLSVLMFAIIVPARADTFILALPSGLDSPTTIDATNAIGRFVQSLPNQQSHTIVALNGYTGQELMRISADDLGRAGGDRRKLLPLLKARVQVLNDYMMGSPVRSDLAQPKEMAGIIDVVRTLTAVASTYGGDGGAVKVIIAGKRYYVRDDDAGRATIGIAYPADGNLLLTSVANPFGTADLTDRLKGVDVIFSDLGLSWGGGQHREALDRFWHLYIHRQGGRLNTVVGDLQNALNIASGQQKPAPRPVPVFNPEAEDMDMNFAIDRAAYGWVVNPRNSVTFAPAYSGSFVTSRVAVAIRWNNPNVDYDLHVRTGSDRKWINFKQIMTPDGRHFKDLNPATNDRYEVVELTGTVDLRRLQVYVNLYKGSPKGTGGEIRLRIDNYYFIGDFQSNAVRGDRGAGLSSPMGNAAWIPIDVTKLVKIPVR